MKTIYLKYKKEYVVDRENFINTYSGPINMLKGAPLLFNVEGTYINIEHLVDIAPLSERHTVSLFVTCIRNAILPKFIEFKWRRPNV